MIQRLCSSICGIEPERVAKASNHSKRKVVILGLCTLIPTIMWMISAFLTAKAVSDNLMISVGAAIVFSTLVFVIEKSIVSNPGKLLGNAARLRGALALVVAILGTLTLDQIIFENDIQAEIDKIKSEEKSALLKSRYRINGFYDDSARLSSIRERIEGMELSLSENNGKILSNKSALDKAEIDYQNALNQYNMLKGKILDQNKDNPEKLKQLLIQLGPPPSKNKSLASNGKIDLNQVVNSLNQSRKEAQFLDSIVISKRENSIIETDNILKDYNKSLLQKYRATFNMLRANWIIWLPYSGFFFLLFFLELLPLVLKNNMSNTQLERELAMEDLVLPQNFPIK